MQYSKQRRLIFIHNQKTGGESIAHQLAECVPDLEALLPRHGYATDAIARLGRAEWDRCYTFGFVRNPWARLVSWYRMIAERPHAGKTNPWWFYVRAKSASFEEFILHCTAPVLDRHGDFSCRISAVTNQVDYFTDAEGRVAVNFIGRFEHLQRDFAQVQTVLGLPFAPLPHLNTTRRGDYRDYYSATTRALVAERFARDIQRFGYSFDDGAAG